MHLSELELFQLMFFGVWALVGGVFIGVSMLFRRFRKRREEACTEAATAEVVDAEYRRDSDGGAYYPAFRYPANGRTITVRSNIGSRPARYHTGDRVMLYYDPAQPERYYLEGESSLLERIFLFVGLGCVLIGATAALLAGRIAGQFIRP